jgi:hypothetical protein
LWPVGPALLATSRFSFSYQSMMQRYLLAPLTALVLLAAPQFAQAQITPTGGVGIGTLTPDASAALEIKSTSQGLLLPRLSLSQRDALTASTTAPPVPGLVIYQTDNTPGLYAYDGTAWVRLGADNLGNHTATQNLSLAGFRLVGGSATVPGTSGLSLDDNGLVRLSGTRPSGNYSNGLGLQVLDADAGFLVRTSIGYGPTNPPMTGPGDRLMWSSYYGAFRAGSVDGSQWDSNNMGFYSTAFGYNTTAAGPYSLAAGYNTTAAGSYSLAAGYNTIARGNYSTALGYASAVDQSSSASLAFGRNCRVSGSNSTAGGYLNKAQGTSALALGERCVANADYAIALGRYASAAAYSGSFTLGDGSSIDTLRAAANNQFSARYAGGYRLYSNATRTLGVQMVANGNAWTVLSDSTKKERRVLADGNRFLASIGAMRLGSWNYKGQSPDSMRHYGPMAQDFYAAFGHDGVGRIGNATGINQADFDGVNLIAIQALYRRLQALEAANAALGQQVQQLQASAAPAPRRASRVATLAELRHQNAALQARAASAEAQAAQATATLETFEARLERLEAATGGQAQR